MEELYLVIGRKNDFTVLDMIDVEGIGLKGEGAGRGR